MKRIFGVGAALVLALGATSAQAAIILGAMVGKESLDMRYTAASGQVTEDTADSDTSLGLVIGVGEPGGGNRIIGTWSGYSIGGDADLSLLNFSYNYFFPPFFQNSNLQLRPFLGGELGYGWLDVDALPGFNSGDDSGFLYGARAGLNLAISQRAEFEVGAHYSIVNLDASLSSKLPAVPAAHYEVRNNMGWWVGFNFGF